MKRLLSRRTSALWLLATGGLSSALITLFLHLWRMRADVPLYADGDTPAELMLLRNIERTGWFQSTSLLNAPFGQDLRAFPGMAGDTLHLLTLKLMLHLTDPVGALNAYYLLSFPLVAVSCHLALRRLRVTPPAATFLSVLFSLAPYHFAQSERHAFLSAYFMVPWACVVLLKTLRGELPPVIVRRPKSWAPGTLFVLLLATTGIYYAAFFLLLLGIAVLLRLLDGSPPSQLVAPVLIAVAVLAVIGVEALPNLLHPTVGSGALLTGREYAASEQYGLKIDHLLLPSPLHRVGWLGLPARRTFASSVPGEGGDTLGLLAALGMVLAVLAVLSRRVFADQRMLRDCGTFILAAVLVGTIAGLGGALSALGVTYIRTWSRIAIFILFFAFVAAGTLWELVCTGLARLGSRGRIYRNTLAPLLFVLAFLDQTTPGDVPEYDTNARAWRSGAAYVASVEREVGPSAAVFQLPLVPFPEGFSPDLPVSPYDGLLGYLHSDSLRWSFGGIRGESAQWQPELLRAGLADALPGLRVVGFTAVQVDRSAYSDRGIAVERVLRGAASQPPVEDSTARWATYLIDRVPADPSLRRDDVLDPVQLRPSPDFLETRGAESLLTTRAPETTITLHNTDSSPRRIRLRGEVGLDRPGRLTLGGPDGALAVRQQSPRSFLVDVTLEVPPGKTTIHLRVRPAERGRGPDPQVVVLSLHDLHVETA